MVLSKEELVQALQNEVRILLHLSSKIEPSMIDYRPTPKQRSTIELLRYLSHMAPLVITAIHTGAFDGEKWQAAVAEAASRDLAATLQVIGAQADQFPKLLAAFSDADLRAEIDMFGRKASRGSHLVNIVLCSFAAYRMQLFLYLKSCGREELNTMNLWGGMDGPV